MDTDEIFSPKPKTVEERLERLEKRLRNVEWFVEMHQHDITDPTDNRRKVVTEHPYMRKESI